MQAAIFSILAQVDIEINPKLIFGIIFLIIWGISAVVSWLNKQQQQARRRRIELEMEQAQRIGRMVNRPPPAPPQPAPVRRPAPQRISEGIAQRFPDVLLPPAPPPVPQQQRPRPVPLPPPQPPRQPAPRRQAKQPARRAIPVPPPEPLVDLAPMETAPATVTPIARPKPPTVDAGAIRGWMTPHTLRQQFILTELLQPPLGMRPDPHEGA